MSAGEVAICNEALGHLRATQILTFEDGSVEADACKLYYASTRDQTLEDGTWGFATRFGVTLAPLTNPDGSPVEIEWRRDTYYLYAVPGDCVKVLETNREDDLWDEIEHEQGRMLRITRNDNVQIMYTRRVIDTTKFSATFHDALVYHMAMKLSQKLRGKESLTAGMKALYDDAKTTADQSQAHQRRARQLTPSNLLLRGRR